MTPLAAVAAVYTAATVTVGTTTGLIWHQSGGRLRGAVGFGALGAIAGPGILAHAAYDIARGRA